MNAVVQEWFNETSHASEVVPIYDVTQQLLVGCVVTTNCTGDFRWFEMGFFDDEVGHLLHSRIVRVLSRQHDRMTEVEWHVKRTG